ncbi:response regulator transcription factor [Neobacillus cucumis]|uniref:response regulator transcription factor n=1 Tax=Neobacillus cucumis TaxID=1740721 RepID=UPI0018E0112D|nr:response regulator transcription factor [Neobacillus cucumis]MBI0575774.1 response regulator transcription factor [Neobacillus cucumis]WHY89967.1 response regulator transcription factor [Neobacillus cucumis]
MKILVIEDNKSVCTMIEMFFAKEGIQGEFINNGLEGYNRFKCETWDALIVDWMLPGMDGVTICRKIREEKHSVPIIMLTAKDSESDQVLGLEMGADDYVTKPFSPLTLMARIKAVTRRFQNQVTDPQEEFLETEHFKISKNTREVIVDGENITNLTPKEFDLLYYMIEHPKQVFSREQLLERVWGYQFYGDERTVDVHIKRLRKKVEMTGKPFFHTVWGVGYKFDESIKTDEI